MPGVRILCQTVTSGVIFPIFQVVWSDFLQETCIMMKHQPSMEEQPGPPLSHMVTGSELFAPFVDSTNT